MHSDQKLIALVTGANTGVGFQIAKALVEDHYLVYIASRNIDRAKTAAESLGENAVAIELDVTKQHTIDEAAAKILKEHGKLDLLVNNAGISHAGKPGRTMQEVLAANKPSIAPIEEMRTVWDTNVFGVVSVTQTFLPLLKNADNARIVNVSSGLGSLTLNMNPENPYRSAYDVVYGASKAAMNAITVAFALELENTNIKISAVSPGFTATALNNFEGTDTVEEGSKEPVRVALEKDGISGLFTGPGQEVFPW
ncbi:SDR family NAD(P)-dependent oxidoreductase [Chryseobacterium caseinilyticum]|uniref:SDR family NAD(P)-dependent oxidoreductase n=1 Tax=Chryseobacterium caseinilyticum TaxID=2771428 RepID=A0ABR8ZFT5_9FLAO|nr:SDR family NAD(P)-dependent oxidoreductase [Chryseobacterium caseinilyticum]MBD8084166.1 SDR family NAD(P)-dependent oxidoreductase [Chryseobacterium caseinilyticum]